MDKLSLLFPDEREYEYKTLDATVCNDLSIDFICDALTEDAFEKAIIKKTMTKLYTAPEVITYRADIFEDLLKFPQLCDKLERLLHKLNDLRELKKMQKDTEASSMWTLINRLREIDDYINCISEMKQALESVDIQSQGLKKLQSFVCDIYNSSGFPELKSDIEETFKKAQNMKSATIGVNFDNMLRPKSAGVITLNDKEFTDSGLLKNFMNFAGRQKNELHHGTDVEGIRHFHPANPKTDKMDAGLINSQGASMVCLGLETPVTGGDNLSSSIQKAVTDILKKVVKEIQSVLQKYVDISGYSLVNLTPEIIFYIRWAVLIAKIKELGLPMCKSSVIDIERREFHAEQIYNLKLAIKMTRGEKIDVITNKSDFDENGRIYIMTGPNRGGKTTFTQAVGIAFLMAQNGIFAPAQSLEFSPCDSIFTHFPADENQTVDLGRLGEESKRLSEIFEQATDKSLLLLNETLATTNVEEGVFLARDIVRFMKYLGVRAIYNTHMHDLARGLDKFNEETEGSSRIESLVTGIENGARSFHVAVAPPQNVSYAKDIAIKYGITFEQLKSNVKKDN